MSAKAYAIAGLAVFGSVVIINYYGNPEQPFDLYEVRFCPLTANKPERYGMTKWNESQERLNREFCNKRTFVNKDTWQKLSRYRTLPDNIELKLYPATTSWEKNYLWFVPLAGLVAYSAVWAVLQREIDNKGEAIESFKEHIKRRNIAYHVNSQLHEVEEQLAVDIASSKKQKAQTIAKNRAGLIDHDTNNKVIQVEDAKFNLTLAEIEKRTMEALRDKAKAETEFKKHSGQSTPDVPDHKANLIEELKSHEDGWLYDFLCDDNQTPIWITGNRQGCGKTSTMITMGLIRLHCFYQIVDTVMDRHYESTNFDRWELLNAKNKCKTVEEIAATMAKQPEQWIARMREIAAYSSNNSKLKDAFTGERPTYLQILVDEFTHLKEDIGEVADNWFKKHTTETRKSMYNIIGVTHNTTNASFADGTKKNRSGNILIERYSVNSKVPMERAKILTGYFDKKTGEEILEHPVTFPDWFQPELVHDWIVNGIVPPSLKTKYN